MRKIILGSNLSALAFGFYHPDSLIVGPNPGENKIHSIMFINDEPETIKLLEDLSIPVMKHNVRVILGASSEEILNQKSVPRRDFYGTDRIAKISENFLMRVLKIDPQIIRENLEEKIKNNDQFLEGFVERIDPNSIEVSSKKDQSKITIPYSELISTIPFWEFEKCHSFWSCGKNIQTTPIFLRDELLIDSEKSSMEYFQNRKDRVIRVVKNAITKIKTTEFAEKSSNGKICQLIDRRISGSLLPPPEKCIFLGRNATGNCHWRFEDSVFVAQEGYVISQMMAEQRRFDSTIIAATEIRGEERIQGLILHLFSEVGELLREINWKQNYRKKIQSKASSVLEEGIDIFKLILSILSHFNYTEREIKNAFFRKSKILWDKFLEEFYGGV